MPFVKKELAAVPFGLHVRTNGDGDAIGIGLPVKPEKTGLLAIPHGPIFAVEAGVRGERGDA